MAEAARIISLAERLKSRREERGISQAQAARELDVARTAYRLWELEAAKPAPDRWRLIASWLGVSVTTMLLAEDLVSADEAAMGELAAFDFGRSGRDWDDNAAAKSGGFFAQARSLIDDAARRGDINAEHAAALTFVLERIEQESTSMDSEAWTPAELCRTLPANTEAARAARDAVAFLADGIPAQELQTAHLLVTELVANSLRHGPSGPNATVELLVSVTRTLLRIEVADRAQTPAQLKTPGDQGGYGLALVAAMASRWGAGPQDGRNVTWFELDLPLPGTASTTD
jgi:transcriptional regulator with XRE-family HTH domain/anti-sigma regulatory factor (Ser/Thr protein kinase)